MRIVDYLGYEMAKVRVMMTYVKKELQLFSSLEEGTLVYRVRNGHHFYYYLQKKKNGKEEQRYLGKMGDLVVNQYKRQRFLQVLQKVLKKDEKLLDRFFKDYTDYSAEAIHKLLP